MKVVSIPVGSPLYDAYVQNAEQFERVIQLAAEQSACALGRDACLLYSTKDHSQESKQAA